MANTKTTTVKKATTKPAAKTAKVAEPEQEKKETVTVDGFELAGTPDVPAEVKEAEETAPEALNPDTTTTEAPAPEEEKSVEEEGVEAPEKDETTTDPEVAEPEAAPVGTEEEPEEEQGVETPEKEDYVAPETEVKEAPVPENMAVLAAEDQRKMNEGARVAEYAPVPQRYDGIVRTAQKLF